LQTTGRASKKTCDSSLKYTERKQQQKKNWLNCAENAIWCAPKPPGTTAVLSRSCTSGAGIRLTEKNPGSDFRTMCWGFAKHIPSMHRLIPVIDSKKVMVWFRKQIRIISC